MDLRVHDRFDSEPMDLVKGPEDRSELVHYDQFASELVQYDQFSVQDSYVSEPIDYTLVRPESSKLDQNGNLGNYELTEHVQSSSEQSLPINFSQKALDSYELIQYEPNQTLNRNAAVIEHEEKSSKAIQNVQIEPIVSAPLSFQAALLILQDQAKTKLKLQAYLESYDWLSPVNSPWSKELVKISTNCQLFFKRIYTYIPLSSFGFIPIFSL